MSKAFLIGITGRAGSGKDSLASMLGYATYAFARPLKEGLAAMGFPEPARENKEDKIPGFDFTWRQAAQTLGTEWGRELQSDLWLAIAKKRYETFAGDFLVITDVRFHNEADWVRENGILVHMRGRASAMTGDQASHASEQTLPARIGDFTIDNGGSLNQLKAAAASLQNYITTK